MEVKDYQYSLKCIPTGSKEDYMKVLIARTEQFILNIR